MTAGIATVVKDRVGRQRYVAFHVEGGLDLNFGQMMAAIRDAAGSVPHDARPWLVQFKEGTGIVRCPHRMKDEVIDLLRSIHLVNSKKVAVRTLGTSGTLRKAIERYTESSTGQH